MDKHIAITADGLIVQKDRKTILDKLTFEVPRGSITGLIGPSGSGKTTLMRTIVGVQKSTKGDLMVLGQDAGSRKLRSSIGYVTQSPAVYGDLTVLQNLYYFGALAHASHKQIDQIIKNVRLKDQRNQIVDSLSGGQRARVSLAVALLGDPDLYIFDEPTVGLDPVLRNELWNMFKQMAVAGKTLLISSHVMDEADRCENLMLLRDGKLLWNDTREALLHKTKKDSVGDAFIAMIERREND
ncbi:MAG: ABC transporter ATP-binding protein [Candidatus Nomurabacteria bacterium]|nr:MAG: ABC transporter ATP-binding protein [Candidatus Nomurabacteria bacterium]